MPENYLFYPAQFWPHKNHVNLLYGLKILKDKYGLCLPLFLTGSDKGNQEYIKRSAEYLSVQDQVYFLGYVTQEEMIAYYQHAYALVYVSLFGPENLPPLEAMALGCPVIAMDVSGMKEQLADRAIYADPENNESIADQIYSLYSKPELRNKLINKGKQRASAWTGIDYVKTVLNKVDNFEYYRRCWE